MINELLTQDTSGTEREYGSFWRCVPRPFQHHSEHPDNNQAKTLKNGGSRTQPSRRKRHEARRARDATQKPAHSALRPTNLWDGTQKPAHSALHLTNLWDGTQIKPIRTLHPTAAWDATQNMRVIAFRPTNHPRIRGTEHDCGSFWRCVPRPFQHHSKRSDNNQAKTLKNGGSRTHPSRRERHEARRTWDATQKPAHSALHPTNLWDATQIKPIRTLRPTAAWDATQNMLIIALRPTNQWDGTRLRLVSTLRPTTYHKHSSHSSHHGPPAQGFLGICPEFVKSLR